MPPKSLDAWLAKCVEDELSAVIEWKQQLRNGFKPDPESRFSDDGSNFRSEVRSPPASTTVQLIEVLTWEDVATAYVSDGIMKVKVRLSMDAVATFEEDSGGSFNSDVKGDVFRLVRFTVVSTPFGPADGFVQLDVEEIEYEALRRGLSDGMPMERDYGIRTLIENTKLLRVPENATADTQSQPRPAAAQLQAAVNVSSSTAASTTAQPQVVQTQRPVETQRPVQTRAAPEARPSSPREHVEPPPSSREHLKRPQAQNKRKHPGPTLSDDGYEVEGGVNLQGPVLPNNRDSGISSTPTAKQAVNTHLLGLLGVRKAPASRTGIDKSTSGLQTQGQLQTQHCAIPAASITPVVHAGSPERAEQTIPESSLVQANASAPTGDLSPPDAAGDGMTSASQLDTDSLSAASLPRGRTLFAYARRGVSTAQRKLLDDPASWLPSLPGRQFPKPNVPMELLSKWNSEAAAGLPDSALTQHSRVPSQHEYVSLSEVLDDSDSDSTHSEYPPSPEKNWLPRQAAIPPSSALSSSVSSDVSNGEVSSQASPQGQHRPDMPPSSTLGSVIHGTPLDGELEIAAPRPLPARNLPEKRKAHGDALPPTKRPSLPSPRPPATTDTRVRSHHFDTPGRQSLPLAPRLRASQQSSSTPTQAVTPAGRLDLQPHATITIRNPHAQAPASDPVTRLIHPLPARPSTIDQSSWQDATRNSSPGSVPTTQQPSALSTPTRQAEKILQIPAPLEHFKNGITSLQPPSGPRSDQLHPYQRTQPGHGVGGGSRNRARENEYSAQDTSRERPEFRADPPRNYPAEVLMHQQFAPTRQGPNIRVTDLTDLGDEIVSSSISPRQDPSRALAHGEGPLSIPHVVQSHVDRSVLDRPARTKPTLSGRMAWLKQNYTATSSGKEDLPAVLIQYQKSVPKDKDICIDDILQAARYAFDGVLVTPDTRYTAKLPAPKSGDLSTPRSSEARQSAPGAISLAKQNRSTEEEDDRPIAVEGSPAATQHPRLLHRQKRTEFIDTERRKAWLQSSYAPSSSGTVSLSTVLEHYRQAYPEDDQVQLDTLLSVARSIPPSWDPSLLEVSAETLYCHKSEAMGNARSRMLAKHSKTGETAYERARMEWINNNYKPGRKGTVQLATVMARYKHSCPNDGMVVFEDFLRAAQAAWPNQGVTPGQRWTFRHELENPPRQRSPADIEAGKARYREHKAHCELEDQVIHDIVMWLRTRYTWDPAGQVGFNEIWVACEKVRHSSMTRKWFLKVLDQAFPTEEKRNMGTWRFSALRIEPSDPDSAHRTDASTESSAVSSDSPVRWFQEHYRKNGQGLLHIGDVIRAFVCRNPGHVDTKDERLLKALHSAFGIVSDSDRFSRRVTESSMHGGLIRPPATLEADSCGSGSPNKLNFTDLDVAVPKLESIVSVADLCAAFIKIQHGRHNAFGRAIPKTRQKWAVDVLEWDI